MYGSIEGVKDNLPKLAIKIKPEPTDGSNLGPLDISEKKVETLLQEISDQVDAALAARYQVPFSDPAPGVISGVVNDLAAYRLATRYLTQISAEENMNLLAMRKDANLRLEKMADGSHQIPGFSQNGSQDSIEDLFGNSDEAVFDMEDESTWQDKL